MTTIALTGATGLVGSALVSTLLSSRPDLRLRVLVRAAGSRALPDGWRPHAVIDGDLDDDCALEELVQDCDQVVHIAAAISGNSAADFERPNIYGTRRLVEACRRTARASERTPHFILVSSLAARAPTLSWYAASKRAAEDIVQTRLDRFSVLRPPAVYGPDDPALGSFWRQLARGRLIRLGPARQRFSLLHVDDLSCALLKLLESGPSRSVLELSGPQPEGGWSWSDLARCASGLLGREVRTIPVPATALKAVAAIAPHAARSLGRRAMLCPGKARELRHHDWVCDNRAISEQLEWTPQIALESALPSLPGWSHP